jgi:predicted aspartyl protease
MWKASLFRWRHLGQHHPRPSGVALLIVTGMVLLSLSACAITIGNAPPSTTQGPGITVPVQVAQDSSGSTLVLTQVKIHGKGPYTFAVDTGASTSLISSSLAKELDLKVMGGPVPINGIGGATQSIPVQIDDWSTGSIRLPSETIASATIPQQHGADSFQGLLGSDIWSQFGRLTLDYSHSTLTVYKQIAFVPLERRLALVFLSFS